MELQKLESEAAGLFFRREGLQNEFAQINQRLTQIANLISKLNNENKENKEKKEKKKKPIKE